MRNPVKVEITALLIISSMLLLTLSNCIIFSGSVQDTDEMDNTDTAIYPSLLYDSVEFFPEGSNVLTLNHSFQKDWIYYFSFESYVPFSDIFTLDVFCQTPASRNYHFFDYNISIENDITKIYFEYGATESGDYLITIEVTTSQNINLHIFLEEYMPLDAYYSKFNTIPLNESSLFSDIHQYSLLKNDMEYEYPVKDDVAYKFNFFRVNPISLTDITENLFENPTVEMKVTLDEIEYEIYRTIPTLDYSLYGNVENEGFFDLERNFINDTFTERFGAHCTGNLTIDITLEGFIPFDLNFAFLVWEVSDIGNGTDGVGETDNSTIPNPFDSDDTELYNKTLANTLDSWLASIGFFIESNWWTMVIVVGAFLIFTLINGKYKFVFKSQINKFKDRSGSDVYDMREETLQEATN
ncbi:hypothetical protein DSAG12_02158 [Promethearchaeum syntrophicum]|uniref:Uncharacterized protein n=1 Tax=Promethearchaeum syntrophicum TaxID=2594042 RepID=A0A5B9DB05_9ARCH|nr:hypothetical protein [Candidatus Prometheoarchaeum syntrophicum]QEE16328.1 hypothetical protein DSAG12_02158 [Candidatus Prometheoarchaeum syntrophicum]